jgi:hypothetical protein
MNTLWLEQPNDMVSEVMIGSEEELTPEQAARLYIEGYMFEENLKDPREVERRNVIETAHIGAAIYGSEGNQVMLTPEQLKVASLVQHLTMHPAEAIRTAECFFNGNREIAILDGTRTFLEKEYYIHLLKAIRLETKRTITDHEQEKLILIKHKIALLTNAMAYFN